MNLLDASQLANGDIIFTRDKFSSTSWIIRTGTFSGYSHAILYVGGSSFIDSDIEGVHSNNLQRLLFENPNDAAVKRYGSLTSSQSKIICDYARWQVGQQYSKSEALRSALPKRRPQSSDRQFCSRLVAQAYMHAGIRLAKDVDYCTPQELFNSDLMFDLPNVSRKALATEVAFATDTSRNGLKRQEEITNHILARAREITGSAVSTIDGLIHVAAENPTLDPSIALLLRESGYLTMWQWDINLNPHWYDPHLFATRIPDHHKSGTANEMLPPALSALERFSFNLAEIQALNVRLPSETGELFATLEQTLCSITQQRIDILKTYATL